MEAFALTHRGKHGSMCWHRSGFELWLRTDREPKPTFFVTLLMGLRLQQQFDITSIGETCLLPEFRLRRYVPALMLTVWAAHAMSCLSDERIAVFWYDLAYRLDWKPPDGKSVYTVDHKVAGVHVEKP